MLETELFCLKKRGIPMSNQKIIFPSAAGRKLHATEEIAGFPVRPGLFLMNGADACSRRCELYHPFDRCDQLRAVACSTAPSSSPMPCCRFPTVSASATPGR